MTFVDKVEALRQEIIYPKVLAQLISVQCDEYSVRVRTTSRLGLDWNQRFSWNAIAGACCVFGSGDRANILFLDLRDRGEPGRVLLDSPGAEDFFSQLVDRGIFPIAVGPKPPLRAARSAPRRPAPGVYGDARKPRCRSSGFMLPRSGGWVAELPARRQYEQEVRSAIAHKEFGV